MRKVFEKLLVGFAFLTAVIILKSVNVYAANILYTDKEIYKPGETITVTYSVDNIDASLSPWIGLLPADISHGSEVVNDSYDITWCHISSKSGVVTFTAPSMLGRYDFRFNDADYTGSGKEVVASDVFEVSNRDTVSVSSVSLNRTKLSLQPGKVKSILPNILPVNATNKAVLWSSNNPSVASVNSKGEIKAVNEGEAMTITYDSSKLKYEGALAGNGVRFTRNKRSGNTINIVCTNKGMAAGKSALLNLKFKALKSGAGIVNISSAKVDTTSKKIFDLDESGRGEEIIFIK